MADISLPASKELAVHRNEANVLQRMAADYTITTPEDVSKGEETLRQIKVAETAITARKEEITRPLMKALASARDLFKPFELTLGDAKKVIKAKILAYTTEAEEKARLEEERINKRVEKGTMKAETALGKLEDLDNKKVKTNTRTLVKVRIVDEASVPREWCTPDLARITEAVLRQGAVIPGVERYEEKILVTK